MGDIKRIGVIGAGQMGAGIAQTALQYGFELLLYDSVPDALEGAKQRIEKGFEKLVQKSKLEAAQAQDSLKNLKLLSDLEAFDQCQIVIEAIIENRQIKEELFKSLDKICSSDCILASNTSSITITGIASATERPENVIGMHFMNPVPIMKLVEVIRGLRTSDACYETVKGLAEKMQKTVVTSKDYPGFIVNRVLIPMINEAAYALYEGVASVEDIDQAMVLGCNQPMGPLALADFIGLDTCLAIARVLYDNLGDTKYRPCPLLMQYVEAGFLGKKTGQGFYTY